MPKFGPIKRRDLVRCLRRAGFDGLYSGGRHPFMIKGDLTITVPNPHRQDIGRMQKGVRTLFPNRPNATRFQATEKEF